MNKILIVLTLLATTTLFAQVPRSQHVWVIGEENHSYEPVTTSMPYLMSLAQQYGLATQYYADMHNSISALMHVTAGATVTTNDYTTATFDVPNIVRALNQKGLSFRSYQEDLAYAGFLGMYSGKYAKRHNPLAYFSDVAYTGLKYNNVPFTQLAADLSNGHTGNFNYITPNVDNDAHDGTMQTADEWLRARVPAILNQPAFRPGGDGLLVIFFDEGDLGSSIDFRCSATTYNKVGAGCGGRVAVVLVGPNVKRGFRSSVWYNHETLLKTICLALGTSSCPGGAATAKPMADFFITPLAASPASASTSRTRRSRRPSA